MTIPKNNKPSLVFGLFALTLLIITSCAVEKKPAFQPVSSEDWHGGNIMISSNESVQHQNTQSKKFQAIERSNPIESTSIDVRHSLDMAHYVNASPTKAQFLKNRHLVNKLKTNKLTPVLPEENKEDIDKKKNKYSWAAATGLIQYSSLPQVAQCEFVIEINRASDSTE